MPRLAELTFVLPVDVSSTDPPPLGILDALRPFEVVLLGYFPVPDQADPALIRSEYEAEARARLDSLAEGRDVTEVLVFTHDRGATIDRVADEYGCDAVLTAGDVDRVQRILVPLRGDANAERIVSVVAGILEGSDATATFFHSVGEDGDAPRGELLLRGAADSVTDYGIEADRVDWRVSETGEPRRNIVDLGNRYDLVVLGETEPSLRERIIGETLADIIDDLDVSAVVVRDVE